uniref:Uncharacterized protein n=1 Tax=Candidatus Kentrum sp. MB TaxID=2138164 RepID=A0A450XY68_9GAMM|nr:MAG: hypothetical protein BECKMB1821G_GA0114241_10693 [Candidatus Kentron sp. MB]VFK34238.1 MAG: hypothetical protein BECKMB1821I_GA0114274_10663 [Candidatus Kentron sp. MB]VFK76601.1 MAG: hypothetical protein BECKMB1821H_GA0114242_10654 [Candidatus Kentron sp. MB]
MASVLSARRVSRKRGRAGHFVAAADGLASRMVQSTQYLSVTDLPITCIPVSYTGRAAASEREDRGVFPRHRIDLPFRHGLIDRRYSDKVGDKVRRSPVNIISHCVQVTPPNTPGVQHRYPYILYYEGTLVLSMLQLDLELGIYQRPKRDTPRTLPT